MAGEDLQQERTVQVNFRLTIDEHDRLAAWGFLETGSAKPTGFARQVLLHAIDAAVAENPQIDDIAQLRADGRASETA